MSQCPPVAVCPGPDFLALLAALGAEFGGFALPLGLHALIDRRFTAGAFGFLIFTQYAERPER